MPSARRPFRVGQLHFKHVDIDGQSLAADGAEHVPKAVGCVLALKPHIAQRLAESVAV